MKAIRVAFLAIATMCAGAALAENLTLDAAIGGAVGGAVGGAIGAEVGGRDGAIVGAGLGAATGAAINTRDSDSDGGEHYPDGDQHDGHHEHHDYSNDGPAHPHGNRFCPPGQAKKGRC